MFSAYILGSNKNSSECECVPECTRQTYKTRLSTGAISGLNADKILGAGEKDRLEKVLLNVTGTQYRLKENLFRPLANGMFILDKMYDTLLTKVDAIHTLSKTSLQEYTSDFLQHVRDMFDHDFNTVFHDIITSFESLNMVLGPHREALYLKLENVLINAKLVAFSARAIIIWREVTSEHTEIQALVKLSVKNAQSAYNFLLPYYNMLLNITLTLQEEDITIDTVPESMPQRLANPNISCHTQMNEFQKTIEELFNIMASLDDLIGQFASQNVTEDKVMHYISTNLTAFYVEIDTFSTVYSHSRSFCLDPFYDIVVNINNFKDSVINQMDVYISSGIDIDGINYYEEAQMNHWKLQELINRFSRGESGVLFDITSALSKHEVDIEISTVTLLVESLEADLLKPFISRITSAEDLMVDSYQSILDYSLQLDGYVTEGLMARLTKGMSIWNIDTLPPFPITIGSDLTMLYNPTAEELSVLRQPIPDTIEGIKIGESLENRLEIFFSTLLGETDEHELMIEASKQNLLYALSDMGQTTSELQGSLEVNRNFVE